jgi:hypothetical protein
MTVASTDSIYFNNGSMFPVNIIFTNTLTNIDDLPMHANSPSESAANVTVNYVIQNANTDQQTGGPYSVQFGIGALPISIASLNTNPDPIAVPAGGQIAFDADTEYDIIWEINGVGAHVWSPQPPTVSQGQNTPLTAQPGANGKTATYSIKDSSETHGGGTVSIGT